MSTTNHGNHVPSPEVPKRFRVARHQLLHLDAGQYSDDELLDWLQWFGCVTGDCPHATQAECDAAILAELRSVLAARAIP